ncbi:MAG: hypothetical protein H6828_14675 [Planctomycetes bacterium]|nr:hypothetical protein [Planctomycetota bacterium]
MDASLAPTAARPRGVTARAFALLSAGATVYLALVELGLWSLVLRARFELGAWPRASQGDGFLAPFVEASVDPREFGRHADVVYALLLGLAPALAVGLVSAPGGFLPGATRVARGVCALGLAVLAAVGLHLLLDPGAYWLWLLD